MDRYSRLLSASLASLLSVALASGADLQQSAPSAGGGLSTNTVGASLRSVAGIPTTTPLASVSGQGGKLLAGPPHLLTSSSPEVSVADGGTNIPDGGGPVSFGTAAQGASAPTKTFTVSNTGAATLSTSGLTVPSGYSVTEPLAATITAGGSDTFTVALSTAMTGTFAGTVQFANNDGDENPFNFTVTGTIGASFAIEAWEFK